MKITWHGHSAFGLEFGKVKALIDPFLVGNPVWKGDIDEVADGVTHVLLTHGHDDHIGSAATICKKSGAQLVANFEICMYLVGQGVSDKQINPGNHGGTVDCGGFTTTFVNAIHSSSTQTEGGNNVYLGNPNGLVLHIEGEKSVYHMGDTDIFCDMALIEELHKPQVAMVPIGDRFTMGGAVAALACRRYFNFETILPCHYGTFPIIDQTANTFIAAMEEQSNRVREMDVGSSVTV